VGLRYGTPIPKSRGTGIPRTLPVNYAYVLAYVFILEVHLMHGRFSHPNVSIVSG